MPASRASGPLTLAYITAGLLLLLSFLTSAAASSGDRDSLFINCVQKRRWSYCRDGDDSTANLPLSLRLTGWTCIQDARYHCSHEVTAINLAAGGHVQQFYGKWPFTRFLGVQEPASVVFSILNGYAHYRGYRSLRARIPRWYAFRTAWLLNSLLNINAWIWSAVFHTRDFASTEKLDYFSAIGAILFGACLAIARAFEFQYRSKADQALLIAVPSVLYACHVAYLSLWPFDYSYNMLAGITVGMTSNSAWLLWAWRNRRTRRYAWKIVFVVVTVSAAMALELFDFPPWMWVFDAHSLWHAATVPIVVVFYSFARDDVATDIRAGKGKGKHAMQ
ncbi:Per1-like-domain-containing protein [Geranomyces variabilis]|nr:Per1-like-domain-containing protein [Geranomyces variabilis]KAJ3134499.1 hypothetical protein HDU90_005115 [Geranomyces variabilis]